MLCVYSVVKTEEYAFDVNTIELGYSKSASLYFIQVFQYIQVWNFEIMIAITKIGMFFAMYIDFYYIQVRHYLIDRCFRGYSAEKLLLSLERFIQAFKTSYISVFKRNFGPTC